MWFRSAALLAAGIAALLAATPARASTCTNTYIGHSAGVDGNNTASWSRHRLPGPSDHVCFTQLMTLTMTGGAFKFRSITGLAALKLVDARLELTDPDDPTVLRRLLIASTGPCMTVLAGAATVIVDEFFVWGRDGAMSGSGQTVLGPGARSLIDPGPWRSVYLLGRRLVNAGQVTWADGSIRTTGQIVNQGLFEANSETGALMGYRREMGIPLGESFSWLGASNCGWTGAPVEV